MMEVPTSYIISGKRHRDVCPQAVDRLAASMREIGLRHPVTVRIVDDYITEDGEVCDGAPVLVAGAHRLAAAIKLGWDKISCVEVEGDEIAAELWELAENLHRLDLTKEQRDHHIRRYAELLEARQVSQQNAPKPKSSPQGGRPTGIPRQIAEETGLSVDTVRRALNPKPAPRPELVEVVDAYDAIGRQADAIVRAWNRAGPDARALALQQIEGVVFDNARAA